MHSARRRQGVGQRFGAADIGLALLTVTAMALGGGGSPSPLPEILLQWCALAIIAAVAWLDSDPMPWPRPALGFAAALLALPALQLLPLPAALWQGLPGRDSEAAALALVGAERRWMPLSVSPPRTLAALLALVVPAIAIVLGARASSRGRRLTLAAILTMALLSVVLGAAQLAGGPHSGLRFYVHSHLDDLIGFQANRNAQADVLLIGLMALGALTAAMPGHLQRQRTVFAVAAAVVLGGGVLLTASRSGIVILAAGLAAFGAWKAARLLVRTARTLAFAWGGAAAAGLAALAWMAASNVALGRIAARFAGGEKARPELWRDTLHAIGQYWPAGSGLGTFVPVFFAAERLEFVDPSVPNRAHNDFLELALEAGLPGMVLLATLAGVLAWRLLVRLQSARAAEQRAEAWLATGVLVLLAAHSLVDYPLRSMALATLAGVASGMILAPVERRGAVSSPAGGETRIT